MGFTYLKVGCGRLFNYNKNLNGGNGGEFKYVAIYSLYIRLASSIVDYIANVGVVLFD